MPRRTDKAESAAAILFHDGVDRGDRGACRQQGNIVRFATDVRVHVDVTRAGLAQLFHVFDHFPPVNADNVLNRRRRRLLHSNALAQVAGFHEFENLLEAPRILRMIPRVVIQVCGVIDNAYRHVISRSCT